MRKPTAFLPFALLMLAAFPAVAQEVPRVLFCMGQCYGVDDKGDRIPVAKGTQLAPGLRLETGPDSYMQVKLGRDAAFGMGERARVRVDRRIVDRDLVILDEGRIRIVGGEAIGRPDTRPVELHTTEGNIVLRSADIEVKTPPKTADGTPALTLVKLNVGDARIGDFQMTKDSVLGFVDGKVLDKAIPIGDIALVQRRDPAPAGPGGVSGQVVRPPLVSLPIIDLPATEPRPFVTPIAVSPAIVSPETSRLTQPAPSQTLLGTVAVSPTLVYQPVVMPPIYTAPVVTASTLIMAYPITTTTGTTSLDIISKETQLSPTIAPTAPLKQTITLQQPTTTTPITTTPTTTTPTTTTPITTTPTPITATPIRMTVDSAPMLLTPNPKQSAITRN